VSRKLNALAPLSVPLLPGTHGLVESGKIAIARVVIRTRQHLVAVKPQKKGLMLELMHFPEELIDASEFKAPVEKQKPTNVVDLLSVLQKSIQQTQAKPKSEKVANKTQASRRKKAA
jgi:non-homologous end joining protein Ku